MQISFDFSIYRRVAKIRTWFKFDIVVNNTYFTIFQFTSCKAMNYNKLIILGMKFHF
jgi:hypothetical protein